MLTTPPAAAALLVAPHDPGPRGLLGSVGLVLVAGLVVAHLRVARALARSR
jgi:hypothetical protein